MSVAYYHTPGDPAEPRPSEPAPIPPATLQQVDEIRLKDVRRLALRPGDVLVLRTEQVWTAEQVTAVIRRVNELIPDHKAMVLAPGVDLEVVGAP